MLNRDYVIVDVPSGEEAMLEMRRGPFDLVISDLRLPGIDGLELMRRLRTANPKAEAILITGHPGPEVEAEVQRLKARAFFTKPLRTEELLEAVQAALGESIVVPEALVETSPMPSLSERLMTLRRDLGALSVYLADVDGKIVVRAGDTSRLDVESLRGLLASAFGACLKICAALGGRVPNNVQFFDGDDFDVYVVNVGQFFMLVIVFEGERGAAAMGPVIRYGRQCADDVLNTLAAIGVEQARRRLPATPPAEPAPPPAPEHAALTEGVIPLEPKALDEVAQRLKGQDVRGFWEAALAEAVAGEADANALSFEQAQKLGLVPKELQEKN